MKDVGPKPSFLTPFHRKRLMLLAAGLLTNTFCLSTFPFAQWILIKLLLLGNIKVLTAAGTVSDLHRIPFSFPFGKPLMLRKYNKPSEIAFCLTIRV
jgi:hypothetical protein